MTESYRQLNISFNRKIINESETDLVQVHNDFEIFLLLSGKGNFVIEKNPVHFKTGDLVLFNNSEAHQGFYPETPNCEIIEVHFDPNLLAPFSQTFNLYHCFLNRLRGEHNKLTLTKLQQEKIAKLFKRFAKLFDNPFYADEVLKYTALIELVFYINRLFLNFTHIDERPNLPENLSVILEYIDDNLQHELTLDLLEKTFFINKSHLGRLFQNYLNVSIHEYIILQRISKAKELLLDGHSALEAGRFSGFYDYSNFRKMFKKVTNTSPSEYVKKQHNESMGSGQPRPYRHKNSAGLPDLIVTELLWSPAYPVFGDLISFAATVKNIGKSPVPTGVILGVGFKINDFTETWSDNYTLGLAPGESIQLTANNGQGGIFTWKASAGRFQIIAHVDDIGRIDESNRDNNQLTKELTVRS